MASMNGPIRTLYENPAVPTPDPGSGTTRGGSLTLDDNAGAGGKGLVGTPFQNPLVTLSSQAESSNSGGLPPSFDFVGGIPDAQAPGSTVEVDGRVASPWNGSTMVDKL